MADETVQPVPPGDQGETELRTFLIADIRGYTTYTREHGDEAAGVLAGRFAELVREVVTARGGFLLELRGDEALVVFVSARNALRAAVELQDRFREAEMPRGVGIGLDAGEAVPVEGGYRGGALNIAARLCAQAGPGDVIASETVIHLAARVEGVAYVEPRSYRLKGLPDPVRAVGVVSESRIPKGFQRTAAACAFAAGDRSANRTRRRRGARRRARRVVPVGCLRHGPGAPSPSPIPSASPDPLAGLELPGIAFVDAASGAITGTLPIRNPVEMVASGGKLWALGLNPKAMYVIDPATRPSSDGDVPLAKEGFGWIDGDTIWLTDFGSRGSIGIDARPAIVIRDRPRRRPGRARPVDRVAVGAGSLWVARPAAGEILRLDPATGAVQARIETFVPDILAFGDDALWVVGAGRITRIDPATNRPTFEPQELVSTELPRFRRLRRRLRLDGGRGEGTVVGGRPGRPRRRRRIAPAPARGRCPADGRMWVGNQDAGTISGIDAVTGEITSHERRATSLVGIAAIGDEIAVSVWPSVEELVAGPRGTALAPRGHRGAVLQHRAGSSRGAVLRASAGRVRDLCDAVQLSGQARTGWLAAPARGRRGDAGRERRRADLDDPAA